MAVNSTRQSAFSKSQLRCEIRASKRLGPILASIVQTCARDVGQPLGVVSHAVGNAAIPLITLVLPVERMIEPNQTWCLACRLACFCPDARVSVLVTGVSENASLPSKASAA